MEIKKSKVQSSERRIQLDLRGVECPMNYVKTKLKLEKMNAGEMLEVLLDPGEAIESVTNSLKEDGQEIISSEEVEKYFSLIVKKTA